MNKMFFAVMALLCLTVVSCTKPSQGEGTDFTITVSGIDLAGAECQVVPSDESMEYVVFLKPKDQVDAMGDDAGIIEADLKYFQQLADSFGTGVAELVSSRYFKKGTYTFSPSGLDPDTEYCIYAYGARFQQQLFEATTPVCKEYFTTLKPQAPSEGYAISVEVDRNNVLMVVTPYDDNVLYYRDMVRQDLLEVYPDGTLEDKIEAFAAEYIKGYLLLGIDIEKIGKRGPTSYLFNYLSEESLYYAFAYTLNPDGTAASKIDYVEVKTGTK